MTEASALPGNRWQRFWNRGRWWKALLAAVVYMALYEAFSIFVVSPLAAGEVSPDVFSTPQSVFFALFLPILFGAIVLLIFLGSVGWLGTLFGRQPIGGRWWMWIVVAVVLVPIALRFTAIDYGAFDVRVIALTFATGLLIGFTEEVLTRGIAVKILRDAGHREVVVAVISSALFALLHATNLLSGQSVLTVASTMVFAFGFGMMMYLVLRATGNLIWPILIHALTDPTTFLATGGIDAVHGEVAPLATLAGGFGIVFLVLAVVALFLIRGRVKPVDLGPAAPEYGTA
jgi:uncharacterized protein